MPQPWQSRRQQQQSAWLMPLAAPSVMLCLLCQASPATDRDQPGLSPHPEPRPPHLQGGPSPESRVRSARGAGITWQCRIWGKCHPWPPSSHEHHSTRTLCLARAAGRAGTTRQTNPDLGPHSFITVTSNTQALRSSTWTHRKRGLGAGETTRDGALGARGWKRRGGKRSRTSGKPWAGRGGELEPEEPSAALHPSQGSPACPRQG